MLFIPHQTSGLTDTKKRKKLRIWSRGCSYKQEINHISPKWLWGCVRLCVELCLCNEKDLAPSIWLLCQSYFRSLVGARVVKLISNMPCVPIVLNLQLMKNTEESKKAGRGKKMCGQHIILLVYLCFSQICLAKQLKLHIGKTCPTVWAVRYWGILTIHLSLSIALAAALCWPDASPCCIDTNWKKEPCSLEPHLN